MRKVLFTYIALFFVYFVVSAWGSPLSGNFIYFSNVSKTFFSNSLLKKQMTVSLIMLDRVMIILIAVTWHPEPNALILSADPRKVIG